MKPSIPKGTRDFSPQEMVKRNYIFDTIRQVFRNYGYLPIETPSMENLDTLMGKYGEEGDKLIFKIIDSGYPSNEDINEYRQLVYETNESLKEEGIELPERYVKLVEHVKSKLNKALRYDLTVPFARYVVEHQNELTFPFKRYQIQPVWRADKPQKGRYREFYQCDADVIGSDSLLNEVELIQMIDEVFGKLGVPVIIKINNRKVLQGIAEAIGAPDKMIDIAIAIDKLDKIDEEGVKKELIEKGFTEEKIKKLLKIILDKSIIELDDLKLEIKHNINDGDARLAVLASKINPDGTFLVPEIFVQGKEELGRIRHNINKLCPSIKLEQDFSLARGLNYYTGTILEVKVDRTKCKSEFRSSICGGGRYDDLTGVFGKVQGFEKMSGVGISFGADRIYDVIEELGIFPADVTSSTKVMFVNFGDSEARHCLPLVAELRKAGISAELFPDAAKFKKQMGYADNKKVAYVAFVGTDEMNKGVIKLRNMSTGEEKEIPSAQLIQHIV